MNHPENSRTQRTSAYVWLLAGIALGTLSLLAAFHWEVPGVDWLLGVLANATGPYLYLAAFTAILIEGIYLVGNFFPGSTIVVLLAIISQSGGSWSFLGVIVAIFSGWCLSGIINIYVAKYYRSRVIDALEHDNLVISDRPWTTWFPAFRANYEVTQVIEGHSPLKVFFSSVRVKVWACIGAGVYTLIFPHFIDVNEITNQQGFLSLLPLALIMCGVGIWKLRSSSLPKK
ncbi:hypothetical protein CL653_00120 [bacterium]|nr:hypothetical protein [bacterium]|tara:strand:- start:140 stop:829 length:690 start_codon:yes stop_codon:yes gene_type:complete